MLTIGCHLSRRKGFLEMAEEAVSVKANTFQYFTRNPRGGAQAQESEKDLAAYQAFAAQHGITTALAYAPYSADPATDHQATRDFAIMVYTEDLARLEQLPGHNYLIRPGSALEETPGAAMAQCAAALNEVITPQQSTRVLLDTMAGEGTQIGRSFQQLAQIIGQVKHPDHMGVCLDTAAVWAEGYDIAGHLDDVLQQFDKALGLDKLLAVHLNDSKYPCGSHVDRHARIGEGAIGFNALAALMNHPKLAGVPFYLEEPDSTLVIYEHDVARFQQAYTGK